MVDIPHFDYPFRFAASGHPVVVEQDSIEDVESCVVTILKTNIGDRIELPEFGIDTPLFDLQPINLARLYTSVEEWESRFVATLSQRPDPQDFLTDIITMLVSNDQPTIGDA